MKKLIMLRGLPASGKSTWAKEFVEKNPNAVKRVNKDDLRDMLDCGKWSQNSEKFVLKVRDSIIRAALADGKHVIADDTNFAPKHEANLRAIAKECGADFEIQDFDVDLEECIARDLQRSRSVGERVIRKMYNDYLKPKPEVADNRDTLRPAVICDLDGTLALLNGRNPYDASTCENDLLNQPVADVLQSVDADWMVILMSGRFDTHREQTERWLKEHNVRYSALYMRKADDNRKDAVIKRELFDAFVRGTFNVKFVLDDRNQVVELWRSLGLTCFQVADGDF